MAQQQGKKMTLRIIDCKPVFHGQNNKGDDYTIHEVKASKEDGTLINEKLRSFTALPVGQSIEVTVTPYVSQQYGRSFTLYPGNKRSGTTAQVNDLSETVEQLRGMISALSERVKELERRVLATPVEAPPATRGPDMTAELDARFGADPPFA